jgi:c-di-GMP-binding flagellar brake protein YcgR
LFSKKNDELLTFVPDEDRRRFFRVEPPGKEPLWVTIGDKQYLVKNISAGGIALFKNTPDCVLELGKIYPLHMTLLKLNEEIAGTIKVVSRSEQAFHCEFIALSEEKKEKLHLFILELQKELLRERKKSA